MSAKHPLRRRGFALFEVMVTVFILAIGVLGLAATQIKTYSLTRDADYRSNAALHAEGLAEAMRANPQRVLDASSNIISWRLDHYTTNRLNASSTITATDCHRHVCSQQQLAQYDLSTFLAGLRTSFPTDSVYAQVCRTTEFNKLPTPDDMGCTGGGGALAIKIAWRSRATKAEIRTISGTASSATIVSGYQLRVEP